MMQVVCFKARAEARGREPLTVGMSNAVTVGFEFSPEWAGLSKTAVFTNGKTTVDVLESQWADGVAVDIPHEVLAEEGRRVQVGIYGTDGARVVLPTVWATLGVVLPAAEPSGDESTDPTLPVWAQLQKEIDGIGAPSQEDIAAAVEDYLAENPVEAPVTSVNGMTGDVQLTAGDVSAASPVMKTECETDTELCAAVLEMVMQRSPYIINTVGGVSTTIYYPARHDLSNGILGAFGIAVRDDDGAVYSYAASVFLSGGAHDGTFTLTKLTPGTALTVNFSVDDDGNCIADKTFEEVYEAVQNGAVVTGRFYSIMFPLAFVSGDAYSFVAGTYAHPSFEDSTRTILFDNGGFILEPDDTVEYVSSGIEGGIPLLLPSDIPTLDQVKDAVSLIVHVTESSDGALTADKTYATITDALGAGNCVTCEVSTKARETATYAFAHAGYGYVAFGDAAEVVDDDGDDVPDGIFTHGGVVIYADDHVELREERGVVFSQFATVDAVQNAQTTAETAQTTAETAQTTAETAQTTAETAQTTADDLNARRLAATGGMVWTQSNITSGGNVKIVYADGLWVLSGLDGAEVDSIRSGLWYSEDGKTWVQSNVTIGGYRYATYADGLWVTGREDGAGGGLLYSEDGKTWVKSNVTRGCAYADALYEDGLWVAACDRRLWYSEDGKTWVQSNAAYSFSRLIYGDGLWGASSNSGGGLWFSEDGKTWEATGSPFESGISTPIAYGGGLWIASESDSTHADTGEGLWYSEDGKAWTQSNETSSFGWSAAYVNGLWFAKYAGIVQYSEDGKTWVNCSADDIPIYADGMWVSGGDGLRYSEDGKTWTQSNLPTAQYNHFVPAYGGGLWVASGYIADGKVVGLWYSEDGKTWVQIHNSGASYRYSTPIYGDGVWVTAAGSYGGNGLWYSSDLYAHKEYVDDRLAGLTTLPSPHALTLTGAVEATYDGSEDVTVEIPEGGNDLGIIGAEVGQTVKITAVDESGKPTAWEAVEMASRGEWELIGEVTSDGTGGAAGIAVEIRPSDWDRLHAEAVSVDDDNATYRLVLSTAMNWYDGAVLVSGKNRTMFSAFIENICGKLKIIAGRNTGYVSDANVGISNSPQLEYLASSYNYVRFDTNDNGAVPEGCTLKVWGYR